MLKRFFGYKTLLVLLTCIGSWGITLWSWRNHYRLPTTEEIATGFVLIPTALCLGYWCLYQSVERLKRARKTVPTAGEGDAVQIAAGEPPQQLQIMDYNLYLPVGYVPELIVEALKARDLPGFHPALKSAEGFPLRAAWIDSLDSADFIGKGQERDLPVDVRRALLLASEVLDPLLMRLSEHRVNHGDESQLLLPVHFLVPARWEASTHVAARQWLVSRLSQTPTPGVECQVFVHSATDVHQVWDFVDQRRNDGMSSAEQPLQAVIASDSFNPDDARVAGIQSIPGEGACALLLARGAPMASGPPAAIVHPLSGERRTHSADSPGKLQSALLAQLIQQHSPEPSAIGRVMADADQRVSRQTEILAALHAVLPDLDPLGDCLHVPLCCGDMGAVTLLASLALATAHSLETQKDTLLVSVQDPFWRAVYRIQPSAPLAQTALQELA